MLKESLDAVLLPEAFALVREGAKRVLGLFPYKVQIMSGLHFMTVTLRKCVLRR